MVRAKFKLEAAFSEYQPVLRYNTNSIYLLKLRHSSRKSMPGIRSGPLISAQRDLGTSGPVMR